MTKKILSSTGFLSATSLIEKIGAFIIIPILTHALAPKEYGDLMLGVSYVGIIMLFIYNGLHSAFFRWYSMWKEDFDKKIYEKYLLFIVNSIALSIIVLLIFINSIYSLDDLLKIDFWLFIIILLSGISSITYSFRSTTWIVDNKAYLNLIFIFIKTILIILGVYFLIDNYTYATTKPLIEFGVTLFLSTYLLYEYFVNYPSLKTVSFKQIKPVLKESFVYGWGLQISQVAFWVITSSDRIMLANLTSNEFVAYYSILMIGITIMFVVVAFNNSFSAYYNKMINDNLSMKEINNYIFTYLIYGFMAILVYKLFLYYFSDYIILLLATDEYLSVSNYMYLTSDIILFNFAYLLFSRYLHAYKMVKMVVLITISSAFINILLNYILIQEYGIVGALIASIMAYLSMGIISFFIVYKKVGYLYMKKLAVTMGGSNVKKNKTNTKKKYNKKNGKKNIWFL